MDIRLYWEKVYWALAKRVFKRKQKTYEDWLAKGYTNQPLVSFIIESHNKSVGVKRIVSKLRDYPNAEIVVIDDGSEYKHTKSLMRYLTRGNEFLVRANDLYENVMYDKTIRFANGEYIVLMQDDDEIADLVDIYRDHRDCGIFGFNSDKVNEFVFELRKRYTTKPEAGEYFEVMLENEEQVKALQTLFEFLYEEAELGVNRNDYVKDFIYKVEMEKLHVGKLTDETGNVSFEFYINDEIVAYGDEDLNHNEPTNEDHGYTLRVSFLDNVEELATKHLPNIMKHLLKDKHNFAKKALSEGYE